MDRVMKSIVKKCGHENAKIMIRSIVGKIVSVCYCKTNN